jgi:hypothetical protein
LSGGFAVEQQVCDDGVALLHDSLEQRADEAIIYGGVEAAK